MKEGNSGKAILDWSEICFIELVLYSKFNFK